MTYADLALQEFQRNASAIVQPATANKALKAVAIAEIFIDGIQTSEFATSGRGCHELDPLARPFVHSVPVQLLSEAALAYAFSKLPNRPWANALLSVFVGGEAYNLTQNARNCL